MAALTDRPQTDAAATTWLFGVRLPLAWRAELRAAAQANGVAMADVVRMALRKFLSGRYPEPL